MIKHTQTICRLLLTNCLGVFDHFVGLALKRLNILQLLGYFLVDVPSNKLIGYMREPLELFR